MLVKGDLKLLKLLAVFGSSIMITWIQIWDFGGDVQSGRIGPSRDLEPRSCRVHVFPGNRRLVT